MSIQNKITEIAKLPQCFGIACLLMLSGCTTTANLINPLYEPPTETAKLGERNDHALNGNMKKDDTARTALQAMASYQQTAYPKPENPVMQPAVVRLMWIPDRLNRSGDLIPAHYYYLKVLNDRWAVSDAFELEAQLNGPKGSGATNSNIPYVTQDDRLR